MSAADDAVATQVVALLSRLDSNTILTHQALRNALLQLIEHGGREFRHEVSTRLETDKRIHKPSNNENETSSDEIANFFKNKRYADGSKCNVMIPTLRKALLGLEAGYKVESDQYKVSTPWSNDLGLERQEKVIRQYRTLETQSHVTESKRRLWLLRISYEVDLLLPHVEREQNEKSDIAAAERKFAQLSHQDPKSIRSLRKLGQKYTAMAACEHGLGFLLLLGCQTRYIWEHTLDEQSVGWLWAFCKAKRTHLLERAKTLQPMACDIVRQGFTQAESAELLEQGHIFSKHFRVDSPRNSPTGLQALVAAADQVQANVSGIAGDIPHHQLAEEMRSKQQLPDATFGMTAINQQFRQQPMLPHWQSTTESSWPRGTAAQTAHPTLPPESGIPNNSTDEQAASRGPDLGLVPSLTVYDDSATIEALRGSALQQIGNEQNERSSRPFVDSGWVQETIAQHTPFESALTLPLDELGHDGITTVSNPVDWDYDEFCFEWGYS